MLGSVVYVLLFVVVCSSLFVVFDVVSVACLL